MESWAEPTRVGQLCMIEDAAAHYYPTELRRRKTEYCEADARQAEQGRQIAPNSDIDPGWTTSRPAVRH